MALPVLVLAPGAWHTPAAFGKIVPDLESLGFTCDVISFPSVGRQPAVKDMGPDIQAVRDAVVPHAEKGRDVVMVVHSWAGAVVNSALEGLGKREREANGQTGGVVKLVFMAAFLVSKGVSVFEAVGGKIPELWNVQGDLTYANGAIQAFYNDLDEEEAKHYASLLQSHALATKYAKTTGEAWKDISSVYLICEDDNAIPLFAQEGMTKAAQDAGADLKTERIKASHSPFLSKPKEVVEYISRNAKPS